MVNAGVRWPGSQLPDDSGLLGRQVRGVVRLDEADRPVQVRPAAQRAVDEQQVVGVRILLPEQQRQLDFGVAQLLLQRERELVHARARRLARDVDRVPAVDVRARPAPR